MKKLYLLFAAFCAAVIVGCTPKAVSTTTVETMSRVATYDGEILSIYCIGTTQQSFLRDEFETWKQAGFEDFSESFITRMPTLLITGTTTNGVSYKIDFGEKQVTVNEVAGKMVDGAQYARDLTEADKRFRQFLLDRITEGKFPRLACGKFPKSEE